MLRHASIGEKNSSRLSPTAATATFQYVHGSSIEGQGDTNFAKAEGDWNPIAKAGRWWQSQVKKRRGYHVIEENEEGRGCWLRPENGCASHMWIAIRNGHFSGDDHGDRPMPEPHPHRTWLFQTMGHVRNSRKVLITEQLAKIRLRGKDLL